MPQHDKQHTDAPSEREPAPPTPTPPVSEPLERPAPPPGGEPDLDKKSDREGDAHT